MSGLLLIAVGVFAVTAGMSVAGAAIASTRKASDTDVLAPVGALTSIGTDTVFPTRQTDGWQVKTLNSLTDVEAFLDQLEHCRITAREMLILANDTFAVRWRSA